MIAIAEELRNSMRYWLTGVTVVTSTFNQFEHGMTVSSFTSLSLEPPQILVSLQRNSRTHELIMHSSIFGVTILASDQKEISNVFAGRKSDEEDRMEGLETFKISTGAPFLKGGVAFFDCKVITTIGSGTHTIFIAEVVETQTGRVDIDPLIYYNREYKRLQNG